MTTPPTPGHACDVLATQHAALREMIDHCEELADAVDVDGACVTELTLEVVRLRLAFDEHNRFEEQQLPSLLATGGRPGAVRVSRRVEDHIAEHRAMQDGLAATPTGELRAVLASLRDHLATEERDLVSRTALHDRARRAR